MRLIVHDAAQGIGRALALAARRAGHEVLALTSTAGAGDASASPTGLIEIPTNSTGRELDEAALSDWVKARGDAGAWQALILEPGVGGVRPEFRDAAVELPALGLQTEALLGLFGSAATEPLVLARLLGPLLGGEAPRVAVVAGWLGRSSVKLTQHGGEEPRSTALRMLARKLAFEAAPDGAIASVLQIPERANDAETAHRVLAAVAGLDPASHGRPLEIG